LEYTETQVTWQSGSMSFVRNWTMNLKKRQRRQQEKNKGIRLVKINVRDMRSEKFYIDTTCVVELIS